MIIGVNGKIGFGKDTIGSIIQCLINHPDIPNADLLYMINNNIVSETSKCEIKKFAGKLKTIASLITGIPVENFEDQEFKKTLLGSEWGTVKPNPLNAIPVFEDVQFNALMSVRELLQKLGTEAMRDGLHTNVWVNALFADYKTIIYREETKIWENPISKWIITDMRFPNEMEAVVEKGGITIRVHRDLHNGNAHISPIPHESEIALDDAEFDYEIINDGTIEDLVEKVKEILIKEKLI